ncbi:ASST-domain-containing protein [Dactylonectria macrodidyma]|uniref:ASST-domain-containing protein n=1 Tax=Dactylonectria macrodidyma TaxID=307937 RepID=A0A9P9FUJ7_9HYPO|nr:ASST-domain-containing protein [Dactylonectria macrodidyma]
MQTYTASQKSRCRLPLVLALLVHSLVSLPAVCASDLTARGNDNPSISWYDWGYYGSFPHRNYQSFGAQSPRPALVQTNERCDDGYIFIEPRGAYVGTPGPVVLDNAGELVWMQTLWGQAMDLKVQRFKGNDYITFWHGTDNGTFGEGYYLMLDESYEVFKKVTPAGRYTGDLHEFRITDNDTALMTIYFKKQADMTSYGIEQGWIFDSIFQEVDLETGELLFEWRASDHYAVNETLAPLGGAGKSSSSAFDFFHINSVDKDANGDYLISSRYMCAVAAISADDGRVLWQLGGKHNAFEDLSGGAATNFSWNHQAAWVDNTTLTVFDNGSNGRQNTAKFSRGLMVTLNMEAMTATLVQDYISPYKVLAISQGSVQVLPNSNVLVGWGHVPAFTEFTHDGKVLCETHIGPIHLDLFSWVKNYRTFKYPWVGRPKTLPDVAIKPKQKALYVSWNGATEVAQWKIQSGPEASGDNFSDHKTVDKIKFETRMQIPEKADTFVRVVALDKNGGVLARSEAQSRHEENVVELLEAPSRGVLLEPFQIFLCALFGVVIGFFIAYYFRFTLRRGINRILRRSTSFQYQALPSHS